MYKTSRVRKRGRPMKKRRTSVIVAITALLSIPAASLAWEAARQTDSVGADGQTRCPAMEKTGCPASTGIALSALVIAAEQGCPFSMNELIEKAQRCSDEKTAGLARRAAEGDEKTKQELIERLKVLLPAPPGPVNLANNA
jgi:hypothetical protein